MKKLLGTAAVAALLVGASASVPAVAHEGYDGGSGSFISVSEAVAVALGMAESECNQAYLECGSQLNQINSSWGGSSGAYNIGQNTGANSTVQNNMAIAAQLCACDTSAAIDLSKSVAFAGGFASSNHNITTIATSDQTNQVNGSFGGASGAFNVGQNAGANSVVQNTMAIAVVGQPQQ